MSNNFNLKPGSRISKQLNSDIAKRSITGSFIYIVIWLFIIVPSEFYAIEPMLVTGASIAITFLAIARVALAFSFERLYTAMPLMWSVLFYSVVLISGGIWGTLCTLAVTSPVFEPISFAIIVSTAGLTGGGSASLAPLRSLALLYDALMLMPCAVTIFFFKSDYDIIIGLIFLSYWIGLYSVTNIQYHEYWAALKGSFLLKKHADDLKKLNTIDGLTGIRNRKHFDDELTRGWKRALRNRNPISMVLMDIDHFKAINDRYGHLAGDECLKGISKILASVIQRETDTLARYGGEEFAVILPDISEGTAIQLAEKIRLTVENATVKYSDITIPMTISLGVSSIIPNTSLCEEDLITSADRALYQAKKDGRNLTRVHSISYSACRCVQTA